VATKKQPKKPAKAAAKKKPAKATTMNTEYKPCLYFDGKQIPKGLKGAKLGETVTITAEVKVVNRSESLRSGDSMTAEIQKVEQTQKK
jgi:hypothetical protein